MNNLNKDKDELLNDTSDKEIVVYVNPVKLLFYFVIGWILMPLILKEVISSKTTTVYIMWFYSFFNIKVVGMWIGYIIKAPLLPSKIFKLSYVGKIFNFIYILFIALLQMVLFILFIRHIYINQVDSLLTFVLVIGQPLLSDLASSIANNLFFKTVIE